MVFPYPPNTWPYRLESVPANATALGHIVGHNSFLERHGQGWRFRVRLPCRLTRLTARKELRVRLGTIPQAVALGHARALRVGAQQLVEAVSIMTTVDEAEAAIERWRADQAAAFAAKILDHGRLHLDRNEMTGRVPGIAGDAGFGVDLLLRSAHRETLGDHLALVRRALAGDPRKRTPGTHHRLGVAGNRDRRRYATSDNAHPDGQGAAGLCHAGAGARCYRRWRAGALMKALRPANFETDATRPEPVATTSKPGSGASEAENAPQSAPDATTLGERVTAERAPDTSPVAVEKASRRPGFDELWAELVFEKIDTLKEWKKSRRPDLLASRRLWDWLIGKQPAQAISADIHGARNTDLWRQRAMIASATTPIARLRRLSRLRGGPPTLTVAPRPLTTASTRKPSTSLWRIGAPFFNRPKARTKSQGAQARSSIISA